MNIEEYCTEGNPCDKCQKIYDNCHCEIKLRLTKAFDTCLFCYKITSAKVDE